MTPADREAAGQRIARARRRRGLSQAVLAGLAGRSESWVSQVERGKRGVDSHIVLVRLAEVLRVDLEELTGSADPDDTGRRAYAAGSLIEQAMMGYGAPGPVDGGEEPEREVSLDFLRAQARSAYGAEQSASAIRQRNLANADHLATLHAIWAAETTAARHDRYRDLIAAALRSGDRQPLSHQARWLFRTLHAAELAGLDPPTSSAPPSPPATWPDPAISPPSWTPGSASASIRCSPSPKVPGPAGSPELADPDRHCKDAF